MILTLHIVFLMYATSRIVALNRCNMTYRPLYSLIAYLWAGSCGSLALVMVYHWPEAVDHVNAFTAALAGASAGLAWWCGGNVAELARKLRLSV